MIVWITGISGVGKTTLCEALFRLLKPHLPELVVLDGDIIREIFGQELSYCETDRVKQIKRIQAIARELDRQGLVVIVAALYAHPDLLRWNKENFSGYFEVYLDAPLALVKSRDPKGLYAKTERGDMPHVVGVDIPWHAPTDFDLRIDASHAPAPDELALEVLQAIPQLAGALRVGSKEAAE